MSDTLRIVDIVPGTTVDGPGLRTSVYFAGCRHACAGCHNPQTWPMDSGRDMTQEEVMAVIEESGFDVTFTGGDPLYQSAVAAELARKLRERGYRIWCYTGFRYEEIADNKLLSLVDVLVDGSFVESLRDISLKFRGSSNQRLIDLRKSSPEEIVEWTDPFI